MAQDNFAAGEAPPALMRAYRWREAKTVMRYGAKLASDEHVFCFARTAGAIIISVNRGGSVALASHYPSHPGILPMFEQMLQAATTILAQYPGFLVELEADGSITYFA